MNLDEYRAEYQRFADGVDQSLREELTGLIDDTKGYSFPTQWPPDLRDMDRFMCLAADTELRYLASAVCDEVNPIEHETEHLHTIWMHNMLPPLELALGMAPVIALTPAQQMALWFTDPSDEPPVDTAFDNGVLIILAEPVEFSSDAMSLAAAQVVNWDDDTRYDHTAVDLLAVWKMSPSLNYLTLVLRARDLGFIFLHSGLHVSSDFVERYGDVAAGMQDAFRFARSVCEAAYVFGLHDTEPPVLRQPRPERRRRDRVIDKRKTQPRSPIRYLRDHAGGWQFDSKRGVSTVTGKRVTPHLRRGHYRTSHTGPMSVPKEDRPTVRYLVKPVIVNGHLGLPSELAVYQDLTRSHRSMIAASSSDHSASSSE